jgi:outer membrane protein OmpA-like peptidoglycan-associated protein
MPKHLYLFIASFGLALAVGCTRTSADTAKPGPAEEPERAGAQQRPLTVSSVTLDPTLASECGITGQQAFFEFDSAQVETADSGVLAQLATCVTSGPLQGQRLELVGHADPRGPDEYNAKLGRSRAQSVAEFLVGRGVMNSNIAVSSDGEAGADPTTPAEWPYDRRVDIRVAR